MTQPTNCKAVKRVARVRPKAAPGAFEIEPQRIFGGLRFPGCARRAYPGYSFRFAFDGHRHLKPAMAHDAFGLCALRHFGVIDIRLQAQTKLPGKCPAILRNVETFRSQQMRHTRTLFFQSRRLGH